LLPGLLAGFAFALYIASLVLTDVVRAILLFYMSPLWSTLLGILVLKERLTGNRVVALLLAFSGLYIVLVVEGGLPIPRNKGDWFALTSGFCWSIASVKLFQGGAQMIIEKVTIFDCRGGDAADHLPDHMAGDGTKPRTRRYAAHGRSAGWRSFGRNIDR
jgi:drug/metabolite transporter (DMT)-like permease